ncbi:sensor histidine kinase [Nonomuraea jiangxiensis]|uniref:histidine kinase n=1 Tax=Nonomuraea jiangxiensis TaxID=633440 RepID=A0A1G7YGW0_9ACTN|nr:histidine kinase [Nonomuraea jiangxiensis]SDG95495.1 Signal transduction histidine kinase [Nonomuraea jiangxiensis]
MRRALSGIAPTALRLGVIALLIVAQVRATPAPGLTGASLAITVLTALLALTLLAFVLLSRRTPSDQPSRPSASNHHESAAHLPADQPPRPSGRSWWASFRSAWRPPHPAALIALSLAVMLAVALNTLTEGGAVIGVLLISISVVATRFPLQQSLPIGLLAVGGLLVADLLSGGMTRDFTLVLSVCLIFLLSYAAKQRRATRAAQAREAVLAERARIAREIHDILAHSLSAQLVHLEGARMLLRAERSAEALDRVTHARDLAKSGLEEASRAVSALRDDPPALPTALRTLAEDFESTTHQTCTLRISGPEHRLSPETELALVRTAQEALTNVRRHAPGSPATVELAFDPAWCDLRITNPASTQKGSPGGGYGLMGMRERAELLGGTLSAGTYDGHFLVHLKVPA